MLVTCSAVLKAMASAGVWSLAGDVLRALRQDGVPFDQRLAAQFVTCFGRLGDIASAEAIFEASGSGYLLKQRVRLAVGRKRPCNGLPLCGVLSHGT